MYNRILVPLDGSPTSERGLREAIGLARGTPARLVLLHVVDDFPTMMEMSTVVSFEEMRASLRRAGEEVLAKGKAVVTAAGVGSETALREITQGRIADAVVDEVRNAGCDLIVMGTHGRRGFNRIAMGSDAELVVRLSPVPVLLVRQGEDKA